MRAFQAAKQINDGKAKGKADRGPDYIEAVEFRMFLVYLRKYFEMWQMFEQIDSGEDNRINIDEFKAALPKLEAWGVKIDGADAGFSEIDTNGGGELLFNEFADWAIKKGLNLEDYED